MSDKIQIEDIKRLDVKEGEILVVKCSVDITPKEHFNITKIFHDLGIKCVIMDSNFELVVIKESL